MTALRRFAALIAVSMTLPAQYACAQETDTYTYDALGRLITTARSGGMNSGQTVSTTYDPAGNRSNYIVSGVGASLISIASASSNEGTALSFTVTRSGSATALAATASAHWATSNGTAVAGTNYTASSGTVSFAAGATSATVTVPTMVDHVYTSNLTMTATLSSPSSSAALGTASATGTIVNTDPGSSLSIAGASATEGTPLTFTVTRSSNLGATVTVNYATSNGTASAGANYTATSGTLSFAANVTSQSITVPTIDDHAITGTMNMTTTLSNPSTGSVIASGSATGSIYDKGWTANLISGTWTSCGPPIGCTYVYGYRASTSTGSLSYTLFNGYTVDGIYTYVISGVRSAWFSMSGAGAPANSGWTSINIPNVGLLLRSNATYSTSGSSATWRWTVTNDPTNGSIVIQ